MEGPPSCLARRQLLAAAVNVQMATPGAEFKFDPHEAVRKRWRSVFLEMPSDLGLVIALVGTCGMHTTRRGESARPSPAKCSVRRSHAQRP